MEQRFVLELEGRLAGRMFSVEGGFAKRQATEGDGGFSPRRIETIEVEPILCRFGTGMSNAFYRWVGAAVGTRTSLRMSGSVLELDHHNKLVRRREFLDALVTEVVFPDLDTSSTQEAVMKIAVLPERVKDKTEGAKDLGVYTSSLPKAWSVNHFRMQIDGLSTDCAHITKIKGLSVKQRVKKFYAGDERFPTVEPTKVDLSGITIELPLTFGKEFLRWHEDMLNPQRMNNAAKSGSIEFLAPGSRSAYFEVTLTGIMLVSMGRTAHSYVVQLTYQSLKMTAGGSAVK